MTSRRAACCASARQGTIALTQIMTSRRMRGAVPILRLLARWRRTKAKLQVHQDNASVFDELIAGRADVMITDAVEARLQAALHPGVLCAAHPERPFDHADKALLLPRDEAFREEIDHWLRARL